MHVFTLGVCQRFLLNNVLLHVFLQNADKSVQTDAQEFQHQDGPVYKCSFKNEACLSIFHSFIHDNTMASDDTAVYEETDSQSIFTGGSTKSEGI